MPLMLGLACALAATVEDWEDFGIIGAMLLLNATIGFVEERKARGTGREPFKMRFSLRAASGCRACS